jgi:hypothetical protein
LISIALITAGSVMGISGLVGISKAAERVPSLATLDPVPGAEHGTLDVRLIAPLPERTTDEETLRLAKQARSMARQGHCQAARKTVERIRSRDAPYADALSRSRALARCMAPVARGDIEGAGSSDESLRGDAGALVTRRSPCSFARGRRSRAGPAAGDEMPDEAGDDEAEAEQPGSPARPRRPGRPR